MGCITNYKAALHAHSKGHLKLNIGKDTAKWAEVNGYMPRASLAKILSGKGHWINRFLDVAMSSEEKFDFANRKSDADFMVFDETTNLEILNLGLMQS